MAAARFTDPIEPMDLANMRQNGVRSLAVSCHLCHHEAIISAAPWPDAVPVPRSGRGWCARGAGSSALTRGRTGRSSRRARNGGKTTKGRCGAEQNRALRLLAGSPLGCVSGRSDHEFGPLDFIVLLFACALSACSPDVAIGEADYAAKIVGGWQGTVGDDAEMITFRGRRKIRIRGTAPRLHQQHPRPGCDGHDSRHLGNQGQDGDVER
jgi:hypothetical protein